MAFLSDMTASYAIPVRRASDLPAASFRFSLTTDTLAVRLMVPAVGPIENLHLHVSVPCRAHHKNSQDALKTAILAVNQIPPRGVEPLSPG
jgi:hypothetical protein